MTAGGAVPSDGLPAGQRGWAVLTITTGLAISVLSNSVTNLALPHIARDLAISAESSIWIVNASQIALMVCLLPVAALADIVGHRRVYRAGLAIFALASLACALAPNLPALAGARLLQGAGSACIMAIQPAFVRAIYPRAQLGRGLGFNTTVVATSLAAGPSLGALLLSLGPWPILFAVYAPLAAVAAVLAGRFLPADNPQARAFDVPSGLLSGGAFGFLILGIDGVAHGHGAPAIAAEFAVAAGLGWAFLRRQRQLAEPMMPIDVFRRPVFALSLGASTSTFTAQGLAFVSLPFLLQTVLGRGVANAGLLLSAWPLALACTAPVAGRLADRYPAGLLGAIGLSTMLTGLVALALLPDSPSNPDLVWRLVLCGVGFGIFAAPNNRLMMNAVPRERSGSAGGMIATARTLGQTLGAALVALVFGLFDFSGVGAATAARAALGLAACFAALALLLSSLRLWRGAQGGSRG